MIPEMAHRVVSRRRSNSVAFGGINNVAVDATRVANAIEFTRFPPSHGANDGDSKGGMLVRAAISWASLPIRSICAKLMRFPAAVFAR